eukprot:gene7010-8146_t
MTTTTTITDGIVREGNSSDQANVYFEKSLSTIELFQRIGTIQSHRLEQKTKKDLIPELVECTFYSDEAKTAKWKDDINEICTFEFHKVQDYKPIKSLFYIGGINGPSSTYSHCLETDKWTVCGSILSSPVRYLWNSTFMDPVMFPVNTESDLFSKDIAKNDIAHSCFDQQEYLYMINSKSAFIRLSIRTKQVKHLKPLPGKHLNHIPHRLVFDHHKQMIYSVSGSDARYYNIADDKWVRFKETVPNTLWCCAVEAIYQ